jgi:hypothetical protein
LKHQNFNKSPTLVGDFNLFKDYKMKKLLIAITLLLTIQSFAQSNPEDKLGVWYAYGGSHKVSEKFTLKTQAQFRFFDVANDLQQLMLRAGVNYKFNNTFSGYFGYAYFNTDATFDVIGGDAREHRIVEDLNINYKHAEFGFAHRIRLEHRFFTNDTRHWIRYQLGINHPLSEKLSAYIYDEVFFNFQGDTYSQNWFGIGVKHKLSDMVKLQLGYHNISLNGGANFNRLIAGISISTNHIKKK